MTARRIVVLGDIHGNMPALESACERAGAVGYDELVIMGDLLTYGVDTAEVIAKTFELCTTRRTTLLRGNHDTFYQSRDSATASYIGGLPNWIQESIEFTQAAPGIDSFNKLPFIDCYHLHDIYFAHANPFGPRDWRYLNSTEDHIRAAGALKDKQCCMGIFAHTHRCRIFELHQQGCCEHDVAGALSCKKDTGATWVLNTGSIGQPRDRAKTAYILLLEAGPEAIHVRFLPFDYNRHLYFSSLKNSALSAQTREQLLKFFA